MIGTLKKIALALVVGFNAASDSYNNVEPGLVEPPYEQAASVVGPLFKDHSFSTFVLQCLSQCIIRIKFKYISRI